MKIKNIVASALLSTFILGLSSCKGNDDDVIEAKQVSELKLSVDDVKVVVGNKADIEVSKGNGDYKVFSLNPNIVDAKIENGKITIEGKGSGKTSIVISDQANLYRKVSVVSLFDKVTVSQDVVDVKMPIGNPKIAKVEILSGNGGYTVTSNNNDILSVKVNKNIVSINAVKEGKAVLTIKDALDVVKEITVNVTTTDIAYDAKELDEIKADGSLRYVFNSGILSNDDYSWYTYYNSKTGDLNLYGYDNYGRYQKIYFAGDKSVGDKNGAKLSMKTRTETFTDEPIKLQVIKNDGTKIWAIYSYIKNNKLNFGHFCQNIN